MLFTCINTALVFCIQFWISSSPPILPTLDTRYTRLVGFFSNGYGLQVIDSAEMILILIVCFFMMLISNPMHSVSVLSLLVFVCLHAVLLDRKQISSAKCNSSNSADVVHFEPVFCCPLMYLLITQVTVRTNRRGESKYTCLMPFDTSKTGSVGFYRTFCLLAWARTDVTLHA